MESSSLLILMDLSVLHLHCGLNLYFNILSIKQSSTKQRSIWKQTCAHIDI